MDQSQKANPSNREQPNPLDADSHAQAKTSHGKPKPPAQPEGPGRTKLLLVCERREGKGSESGGDHQGRIEKDQARLRKEPILCDEG